MYNYAYTYIHNFIETKIIKLEEFPFKITSKRSNESYKLFYQYLKWTSEPKHFFFFFQIST